MVYECEECGSALPAGVVACPGCGEKFEEAVPANAVVPARGFRMTEAEEAVEKSEREMTLEKVRESLERELTLAEEAFKTLQGQMVVFKSEVLILRNHLSTLEGEAASVKEEVSAVTRRLSTVEMARREDRRRYADHFHQVMKTLHCLQYNGQSDTQHLLEQ